MDAPGLGRLAEPRCHAHQHADHRVLRVDVLKSPNITPYAGCMIFWNLAQSRHADEDRQAVPFLLLRESNPHSQLHKLLTYVQQNLPQSIQQIADVCLLRSKGRNGSVAVVSFRHKTIISPAAFGREAATVVKVILTAFVWSGLTYYTLYPAPDGLLVCAVRVPEFLLEIGLFMPDHQVIDQPAAERRENQDPDV